MAGESADVEVAKHSTTEREVLDDRVIAEELFGVRPGSPPWSARSRSIVR
jgi:hypothetical protein